MTILGLLIIDIIIVIIYGIALVVMLITKASSDEIITATAIYCIAATIVNGIVYLYPWINYGEAMQYLDDSPDKVLLRQYLDD
mgnify:CR=1 FL=1